MKALWRLLGRARLLAELRFALGAGLIGAGAGLIVTGLALPPRPPGFATSSLLAPWLRALSPGIALGWWVGVLWAFALALAARRFVSPPPAERLERCAWLVAALAVAAAGAARYLGSSPPLAAGAAVVVATVVVSARLGRR